MHSGQSALQVSFRLKADLCRALAFGCSWKEADDRVIGESTGRFSQPSRVHEPRLAMGSYPLRKSDAATAPVPPPRLSNPIWLHYWLLAPTFATPSVVSVKKASGSDRGSWLSLSGATAGCQAASGPIATRGRCPPRLLALPAWASCRRWRTRLRLTATLRPGRGRARVLGPPTKALASSQDGYAKGQRNEGLGRTLSVAPAPQPLCRIELWRV
jgi:hypothetical protein